MKLRRLCFYRCVSVHTWGGLCLSAWWDTTPSEQTHPLEQTPPLPVQTPPWKQTPPLQEQTPLPRDSHCCGRYASYWNAFLLMLMVHLHCSIPRPVQRPIPIKCVQNQWKFASVSVQVRCNHFPALSLNPIPLVSESVLAKISVPANVNTPLV